MDIKSLKEYVYDNMLITTILEELGCHHIKDKGEYYSACNPDGDNQSAICVYKNSNLTTVNHTREISKTNQSDLLTLVEFFNKCSFFEAVKLVCEWISLDVYYDFDEDIPESLKFTKLLLQMQSDNEIESDTKPLKPISEKILSYYKPYVNDMFFEDNVSYKTQRDFEIGYDEYSNRITIPIRDEFGNLVGIKARYFYREVPDSEMKFMYIEPCARSKILYGLHKAYKHIKEKGIVYVVESEKGVMQLWNMGIYNCVATGGKKVSSLQIEKLTRLCVKIVFLFDKDVEQDEINELANRFISSVEIYTVIDDKNILEKKESPTDNPEKLKRLLSECYKKIR